MAGIEVPWGWEPKPKRKQTYTPRPRVKLERYPWLDGLRNGGRKLYPQSHGISRWPSCADENVAKQGYYISSTKIGTGSRRHTFAIAKDFETLVENIENGNISLEDDTSESVYKEPEHNCVWMLTGGAGF